MKKLFILLSIFVLMFVGYYNVDAKPLNLKEALKLEKITEAYSSYKEDDKQITIYMFGGNGCPHCKELLEFFNSITKDYGKYFKLRYYEVWYDQENQAIWSDVAGLMGDNTNGVPYLVIGNNTLFGYSSTMNDKIITLIVELYNTDPDSRYDVMKELGKGTESDFTTTGSDDDELEVIATNPGSEDDDVFSTTTTGNNNEDVSSYSEDIAPPITTGNNSEATNDDMILVVLIVFISAAAVTLLISIIALLNNKKTRN